MKLYVSNNCPSCNILRNSSVVQRARSLLTIRNTDTDPGAALELLGAGIKTVPTLMTDQENLVGVDSILRYLARL